MEYLRELSFSDETSELIKAMVKGKREEARRIWVNIRDSYDESVDEMKVV